MSSTDDWAVGRRGFLATSALVALTGGCIEGTDAGATDTPLNETDSPTTATPKEPTRSNPLPLLTISNVTSGEIDVSLQIIHHPSGDITFEDSFTIPAYSEDYDEHTHRYRDIDFRESFSETHYYELKILVEDGPTGSAGEIKEYLDSGDLDGMHATITEDDIEFSYRHSDPLPTPTES